MPPTRGSSALLLLFRLLLIPHTSIVRLLHRLRHYDRVECTNRSRIRKNAIAINAQKIKISLLMLLEFLARAVFLRSRLCW
ncbi:hypothetical protein KC367_g112 [Hortaea werneckii]|nr:hypothetical protein KC367_g112 [Hortaea werneckii]